MVDLHMELLRKLAVDRFNQLADGIVQMLHCGSFIIGESSCVVWVVGIFSIPRRWTFCQSVSTSIRPYECKEAFHLFLLSVVPDLVYLYFCRDYSNEMVTFPFLCPVSTYR
jgi:hypothetical protein